MIFAFPNLVEPEELQVLDISYPNHMKSPAKKFLQLGRFKLFL